MCAGCQGSAVAAFPVMLLNRWPVDTPILGMNPGFESRLDSFLLQNEWEAYLPGEDEEWVHFWGDGTPVPGGIYVVVPAPLGYPPVFYRKGSPYEGLFQEIMAAFGSTSKVTEKSWFSFF